MPSVSEYKLNKYHVKGKPSPRGKQYVYASGNFTVPANVTKVDVFLVGGGGGGGSYGGIGMGAGGGGGYTATFKGIAVTPGEVIPVVIGTGGAVNGNGGYSQFKDGSYKANGGNAGTYANPSVGGAGGSGGGCQGVYSSPAGSGGSNGSNGANTTGSHGTYTGGAGQGTTTREFGEASGILYSGGGGGGFGGGYSGAPGGAGGGGAGGYRYDYSPNVSATAGTANSGGGGGGSAGEYSGSPNSAAAGGSGVVVIRWGY